MPLRITISKENYLKAIYVLLGESTGRIANQSIANKLEINPATVTEMLHRLRDKKLIEYSRPEGARLTKVGKDLATKVVRKHRLWETFLVQKLGFAWDEVHDVAEQLEHIQSLLLIQKLDEFLNFPAFCKTTSLGWRVVRRMLLPSRLIFSIRMRTRF